MEDEYNIEEIKLKYSLFLNKMTMIFGGSGSGKSTIIAYIIKLLRPYCDQIIVFAPSDIVNESYSKSLVPKPFIHYVIEAKTLQTIVDRQEAIKMTYNKANNIIILKQLFDKLNLPAVKQTIYEMERRQESAIREIVKKYRDEDRINAEISSTKEKFNALLLKIYQKYINENKTKLSIMNLSEDEKFTLKYLTINPNMIIIFDDCTQELRKLTKEESFTNIFYKGRHSHFSVLMALHSHKSLPSELRGSGHVLIFAEKNPAHNFFKADSNGYDDDTRKYVKKAIPQVFPHNKEDQERKHQKLIYMKSENKFNRFTAERTDGFSFYKGGLLELFNKITAEDGKTMTSNMFNKFFQ